MLFYGWFIDPTYQTRDVMLKTCGGNLIDRSWSPIGSINDGCYRIWFKRISSTFHLVLLIDHCFFLG
jgi:hypothetical protein